MLVVWSFFAGAAVCEKAPAEPDLVKSRVVV